MFNPNKTIKKDVDVICFEENLDERPCIIDIGDGEFFIDNLSQGKVFLFKEEIDDLISLFIELKNRGYNLDTK